MHTFLPLLQFCFKISEKHNPVFDPIIEMIPIIRNPKIGFKYTKNPIDLSLVLNRNETDFFMYNGTTTTPDCQRTSMWLIYTTPRYLSQSQVCFK